jgi:hypothetical protein
MDVTCLEAAKSMRIIKMSVKMDEKMDEDV